MKYLTCFKGLLLLLLFAQLTYGPPAGQAPRKARRTYHKAQRHNARDRARKPHYTFFW
jgi:hypothetical protein